MTFIPPTLAGFTTWLENNGFNTTVLPADSPYIGYAFNTSTEIVNMALQCASPLIYTLCVYNLGASLLISFCPDQAGQTFFEMLRKKWNINDFISGVIQSTSDESTSESMVVPEQMKNLTIANLQQLKDPYGRTYLGYAQSYGQSVWGLS